MIDSVRRAGEDGTRAACAQGSSAFFRVKFFNGLAIYNARLFGARARRTAPGAGAPPRNPSSSSLGASLINWLGFLFAAAPSIISVLVFLSCLAVTARAQVLTFNSSAGFAGQGSVDGATNVARFDQPAGVAMDASGNIFVTDSRNNTVRKISGGVVSTFAGSPGIAGSADGFGTNALFNQPAGIAADRAGNVYVSDSGNHTIRKITGGGMVSTIAGTAGISGSSNGTGTNALFNQPQGICVDTATNLYVADYGNHAIRLISPGFAVTTCAGSPGVPGSADGTGTNALFYQPQGVAVDGGFNVYVTDTANGTIRKINPAGMVTTIAGLAGNLGSSNGLGTNAQFYQPEGIALDAATNLYVADFFNQTLRKITPGGMVTTLAGLTGISGSGDGPNNVARFWGPLGMAVDNSTNLYVADYFNGTIREISTAGIVGTFAGSASASSVYGAEAAARFNLPTGVAPDGAGNVYVADSANSTIRKISSNGQVGTFAGSPGIFGSADAAGTNAIFNGPRSVAMDGSGNIFVADTGNHTIRKISPLGAVSTFAGYPGSPGNLDGTGTNAQFDQPQGVAVDRSNNIYVADTLNNTIRVITPGGSVSTLAGLAGSFGCVDGTNGAARFNSPQGVAVDASGNVYVADYLNHAIRQITPSGSVSTIAGLAGVWGGADGTNSAARFFGPDNVAVDANGYVYVADSGNQTIRILTPSGTNWIVTTAAGLAGAGGNSNGSGTAARFDFPAGIAFDPSNHAYLADSGNNLVRLTGLLSLPFSISNVTVVPRPASAIVSWTTSAPSSSQVAYGVTTAYGSLTALDSTLVTNHAALLTGLTSNSLYYFQITSAMNGAAATSNGSFSTSVNLILQSPSAVYSGVWVTDSTVTDNYSPVYKYANVSPPASAATATFSPVLVTPGEYDVYLWYAEGSNRSMYAPVTVGYQNGSFSTTVNETLPGGSWQLLAGAVPFAAGTNGFVRLGNGAADSNKIVISDAVMLAYTAGQDLPVNGSVPGWWLDLYFGTTNVSSSAIAANGYPLLSDYILGISPNDSNTALNFKLNPVHNGFTAVFSPFMGDRTYQLQAATNLANPVWTNIPNLIVAQTNGQGFINGTNLVGPQTFYRLSVQLNQ